MKTNVIKIFALAVTLLTSSFAFAEEVQQEKTDFKWMVGDTIVVKKTTTRYLTGERPSKWVYLVEHAIQQVGGKRFPNGILIRGIYSWLGPDDILLKGAVERPDTLQQTSIEEEKQKAQADLQERAAIVDSLSVEDKKALENYAEIMGGEVIRDTPDTTAIDTVSAVEPQAEVQPLDTLPLGYVYEYPKKEEQKEVPYAFKESSLDKMHRFSIGVRGGVASLMHETDVMGKWNAGFDALLDLQYAYYFGAKPGKKVNPGILVGLSAGWAQSSLKSGVDTAYTVETSDGKIDYAISADNVKENDGQLQLEIPVMFSMLTEKGFFLNVGPKFVLPVFSHYNQNITSPNINAYFEDEGVMVRNEVITGLVQDNQLKTKGKWATSKLNVMVTAELGWEWMLKNGDALGLGVYGNYSVYDLYDNSTDNKSLINVTAPSATGPANVDVLSATDTYTNGLGYFDCGLKLVYHFNFPIH